MALFNVVQPCVINGLHYIHPTEQPIEVDGDVAAELLAAGALELYPKPVTIEVIGLHVHDRVQKPETDDNKARLVAWLLAHGSELSEVELNRHTKQDLWVLINAADDPTSESD